jgi:hypothetical protein
MTSWLGNENKIANLPMAGGRAPEQKAKDGHLGVGPINNSGQAQRSSPRQQKHTLKSQAYIEKPNKMQLPRRLVAIHR